VNHFVLAWIKIDSPWTTLDRAGQVDFAPVNVEFAADKLTLRRTKSTLRQTG
jgi:hypothetical protein